jgi:hypothetical protein
MVFLQISFIFIVFIVPRTIWIYPIFAWDVWFTIWLLFILLFDDYEFYFWSMRSFLTVFHVSKILMLAEPILDIWVYYSNCFHWTSFWSHIWAFSYFYKTIRS